MFYAVAFFLICSAIGVFYSSMILASENHPNRLLAAIFILTWCLLTVLLAINFLILAELR